MRRHVLFPILLMLAACSGPGLPSLPTAQSEALFVKHGVADHIEIRALNRLPLREAKLTAPNGAQTDAEDIVVSPATRLGESALLGSSMVSPGSYGVASIPPAPATIGGAPQGAGVLLLMLSTGSITLPDPVAYRRDWRRYRIRLRFGDRPGSVRRQVIAAPRPPPAD